LRDPAMMEHLGGPETEEKIAQRDVNYARSRDQFKIVDAETGEGVGWVGYWEREWDGEPVYEIGWSVAPAFQGLGIAGSAADMAVAAARSERARRFVHAFPSVENGASNAVCRKLGFTLVGPCDFEHPPGNVMRCNDWRLDLAETEPAAR
jgi:RimJ/RimL family protein N-acetyltransferase